MSDPGAEAASRPRRLMGPLFWAMVALALACVALGAAIGFAGPRLFPPAASTPAPERGLRPA